MCNYSVHIIFAKWFIRQIHHKGVVKRPFNHIICKKQMYQIHTENIIRFKQIQWTSSIISLNFNTNISFVSNLKQAKL